MGDFYFCTSALTGQFNSNYSNNALADANFNYTLTTQIIQLINSLRSCDWNKQNPAIRRINEIEIKEATNDELFVLGRNIYQSGIGPAWNAKEYLDNLNTNVKHFDDEIRYHIMNGILFEIYFNSKGMLRDEFKTEQIDRVFGVALDHSNRNTIAFLESKLRDYQFRLLYDPSSNDNMILNIVSEIYRDDIFRITQIQFDGVNVLYNSEGSNEYQIDGNIMMLDKDRIQKTLIKKIAVPSFKLTIFYPGLPDEINDICIPYNFKLLNHAIKSSI